MDFGDFDMYLSKITTAIALTISLVAFNASAMPINLVNPSFEDMALNDNQVSSSLPGWTITGVAGTYNPGLGQFSQPVPHGNNTAYVNAGSITQTTSTVVQAGVVYSLQVSVGDRTFVGFPGFKVQILADNDVVTSVNSQDVNGPANGQFITVNAAYSADVSDPHVGTLLGIRLVSLGTQTNFDNVQLIATGSAEVPEPAALSLLLFGGLAAFRRRTA